MKGIVLAGGLGTRLYPLTKVTNKHLLPIYNKPMIYYPIELMVGAGIRDILIVTGGNNAGDFLRLLGNGKEFGLHHINYTYQEGEGGIAAALSLAEFFADQNPICVILGDNIVEGSIAPYVKNFEKQGAGARILLKEVPIPSGSASRISRARKLSALMRNHRARHPGTPSPGYTCSMPTFSKLSKRSNHPAEESSKLQT